MPIAPGQLERAWLERVHFEANAEFDPEDLPSITYEVDAEPTIVEVAFPESGEGWGMVQVRSEVRWARSDESEGPSPFELEVAVGGLFAWTAETRPDERMARLWLDYNAMYLLWPYMRTYVATITGMSLLPPLTLYTMSVPDRPDLDEEENRGDEAETEPSSSSTQIAPS